MADPQSPQRWRPWMTGCAIALGAVAMVLIPIIGLTVFMRAKGTAGGMAREEMKQMGAMAPAAEMAKAGAAGGMEPSTGEGAPPPGDWLTTAAYADTPHRDIIYTAQMTVETDDVRGAVKKAEEAIRTAGGWLGSKNSNVDYDGNQTTTITLRIPATRFYTIMDELRALGDARFENIATQDVTQQVVDLDARLKNLHREEAVIAELFTRQGRITDVLQVEHELARVRGETEQGQATLKQLRESVAYCTITVTLQPKPGKVEQKLNEWNLGHHVVRAWHMVVAMARAVTLAVIYVGIVGGPFIAIALIIWWAIRARRRRAMPPPTGRA